MITPIFQNFFVKFSSKNLQDKKQTPIFAPSNNSIAASQKLPVIHLARLFCFATRSTISKYYGLLQELFNENKTATCWVAVMPQGFQQWSDLTARIVVFLFVKHFIMKANRTLSAVLPTMGEKGGDT